MSISWEVDDNGSVTVTCDLCDESVTLGYQPGFGPGPSAPERDRFARMLDDRVHQGVVCHGLTLQAFG